MSVRHVLPLAAAALAIGICVQAATAVNYDYCSTTIPGYGACDGSAVALKKNWAIDDNGANSVCAGAMLGGSLYGSYACGSGSAYHCYSGANQLNPRAKNNESFSQVMHGHAHYAEPCP